jgi:hypothetical protein
MRNVGPLRSAEEEGGMRNVDPLRSAEEEFEFGASGEGRAFAPFRSAECGGGRRDAGLDPLRGAEEEGWMRNFDPGRSAEEELWMRARGEKRV